MWILPNNYPLSSAFAAATGVSSEELALPDLNIESSLMWRSKPSAVKTWQRRWKTSSWMPRLFGRILKPSLHMSFETKLAYLPVAILANHFPQPVNEKAQKTLDTCGPTSKNTSEQFDLFGSSLRTSKVTSVLDSEKSLATWKASVTKQRGEYSQRVKLALLTRENESTSWRTPTVAEATNQDFSSQIYLQNQVKQRESTSWPTPRASEYKDCGPVGSKSHTHMLNKKYLCARAKEKTMPLGMLNPDWVEWLMGVPTGWTELGCWGMELCHKQPQKHGSHSTKELRH